MANQDSKNFVENMVSAQKKAVDTIVENTQKIANGNTMVNDTVQKGSEWYKNWLDNQKNIFSKTADQATNTTETAKDNMSKMNEFYQNWFGTQMNWAKQMWEMNQNHMKNATTNNAADFNPMNMWNNMMGNSNNWMNNMNNANTWMNGMNSMNNWMNQFQTNNPMNMDTWKKAGENFTGIFNQYYEMLNNGFANLHKNMENGTTQDAYRNMVNVSEGFTRFAEMWTPMWKSIQEKTFNMDMYKQYMNPEMYKEVMDKYFGFMPENSREYMKNFGTMMQNGMTQMGQNGMNQFQQMRGMAGNFMPNNSEVFSNMLNGYNTWYQNMSNVMAPMMKMMTPNQHTKSLVEWNDISNRMMVYSIKNAELQYMIYNQGTKVMDQIAENITSKLQKGEEVNNMLALYQEWLNISDKVYVSLFEGDEYSHLMAEVSAMQLKLRKDVEGQMEKMMTGIPVATRSEMDELYKTIYDLKKQVRQMEKMMELETEEAPATEDKNNGAKRPTNGKKA
jgi:polyhydroxyalkanoate synthesis regulator phasin